MLDEWAHAIEIRLEGQERYPLKVLKTISDFLYGDLGFRGNSEDYYNPDNRQVVNAVCDFVGTRC